MLDRSATDAGWAEWLRTHVRQQWRSAGLRGLVRRLAGQDVTHAYPIAMAGACIIQGEVREAGGWLQRAARHRNLQGEYAWQAESRERIARLQDALAKGRGDAMQVLGEYAAYTLREVGLAERVPAETPVAL